MPGGPVGSGGGIGADPVKSKWAGIAMTAFSAFGGILFGYDTGVINGVKVMGPFLRTFGHAGADGRFVLSSSQESLIVSILSAGTFFGALLGAPAGDYIGRKWGIIMANLVFCIGVAMQAGSKGLPLFVVGRVFAGLGVGLVSCLIPMYQSECSPKWIRGAVVSLYQFAITIGLLLAAVVNNATQFRAGASSWQIPVTVQFIWAFILASGMSFLPESPRWLIKRGRDADASAALSRLTGYGKGAPEIEVELDEIRTNLEAEKALGSSSYLDCFRFGDNKIFFRTLTGIFIQAWQQLTGINFIFYYGTTFFINSGIHDPFLVTVATSIVNVFMTLPGIWGVERFGRRRLLLIGAVGMCVCEYIVAIVGVTVPTTNLAGQRVLIAFVCIYIAFFASTWGPIAWVITGEIFPLEIRAKGMSLSVASNWLWNFAISYATPFLVNVAPGSAGLGVKVFFIWGSTCACCVIFTWFCVPETKGLSLEQIDVMYQEVYPWQSHQWRNRNITGDVRERDISPEDGMEEHEKAKM
ncbi:MFS monosaccharide transporter [Macrolepiota fuliginosa MF-IS2]|uniref:MFS monosaccharide transporter n=1 Tax=Macrolepiota fuliginosa MF-IS2 TaxID=1400762 RepID=A0A9P5XRY8_9AGAR|nr:MFS monosaccharide transporter [Macrolepiota fuliginosa MF-IS2]